MNARVHLVRPTTTLMTSYLDFIAEQRALGETIWPTREPAAGESAEAFVARVLSRETHVDPPGVPDSAHWGVIDERVVGVIALRHTLTEKLARFGGHLGYEVRPSCRRQGIATAMIRLVVATERARAMRRILVTCAPTNIGSRKAIEAAGGVLEGIVFVEDVNRETCHYWIDTA